MRLTLAEPNYLKDSVSIISELVNEASFKIKSNSMELIAMDPANVAMVIFKLLSSAFTEYKVDKEVDLAINLTNLKQILRRAKSSDSLTMEVEDEKLKSVLEMAGGICHELNQPLQYITGATQLLAIQVPDDEKIQTLVQKMQNQVERMGRITKKLMGLTSFQTLDYVGGKKIIDLDRSSS